MSRDAVHAPKCSRPEPPVISERFVRCRECGAVQLALPDDERGGAT